MAQLNLNLENTETQTAFEPLPAGDYLAQIVGSEIKESRSGTHYIKFTWAILDEKYRNRQVFENVSITNPQGKTYQPGGSPMEIGQRKLKTIAVCGNHPNPNFLKDTEELHGLPVILKLKVRHDDQYGPQNDVKGYKQASTVGQGTPLVPGNKQQPPPPQDLPSASPEQQADPTAAAPPWMQAA